MSHTPGIWFFQPHYEGQWLGNIISDLGDRNIRTIACLCQHGATDENLSNARLIAAAPEMLEALEDIFRCCMFMETPTCEGIYIKAKAAIAKAKGEVK